MKLSELNSGEKAVITKVSGQGAFRKRITEMGFVKGREVAVIKHAPLKDPVEYQIMDYHVSLRKSEAELIEVLSRAEVGKSLEFNFSGTVPEEIFKRNIQQKSKTISVAFVGNPNCGKTSLFNGASGSKQKVGNYTGVTVDVHTAKFKQGGYLFSVTDLPGTYSLSAYSPEELFVRKHLLEQQPDVVVNIVDAANLERNLFLTTQLIDMNLNVVTALNMYDELEQKGASLNQEVLSELLGIPMIPTIAYKKKGLKELFDKVIEVYEGKDKIARAINIHHGKYVEENIAQLQNLISTGENKFLTDIASPRFLAVKLIEKDSQIQDLVGKLPQGEKILKTANDSIQKYDHGYSHGLRAKRFFELGFHFLNLYKNRF